MSKLQFLMIGLVLLLSACTNDGVLITTKFANTQDIKEGTSVYLGSDVVGVVDDISLTEHGSVVQLELDQELAVGVDSKAAVVVNRLREGAPLELHNPPGSVKIPVQDGQNIEGLDSMIQLVGWGIGSSIDAGSQGLAAISEYLKSDDFEHDKAQAGIALDRGLKAAKTGLQDAEKELVKTMADINLTEEELAEVITELGEEMGPMVKELAASGTELLLELERFAENLEHSSPAEQRSGELFFNSLTKALEDLNHSFEEGVEQGSNSADLEFDPNN
ncbi:hypothetical protein [Arenicella sp. 4NH20-0111]|uniref:hypothetical protein n=1 Tax=Arenicella sp. 4NH20-0111 TaxID=3127648 RepID=UPI003340F8C7